MTVGKPFAPKLRFPEFHDAPGWPRRLMGRYLSESRIKGSGGHEAKKLTVKLWGKGVFKKNESVQGSANTQYYRRRAGQFIYSKLDFLNQAFGIIPVHLDGFESTVDLPCFDIASEMNPKFLLGYVQREQFYKTRGEIADGGRKAKRIQVDTFLDCPIYTPSEPEQQKIADCLGSLDDVIAAQGRNLGTHPARTTDGADCHRCAAPPRWPSAPAWPWRDRPARRTWHRRGPSMRPR